MRYWIFLVLLMLGGCEKKIEYKGSPLLTFEVDITSNNIGSPEAPLPFSRDPQRFTLDIRAIDKDGGIAEWFSDTVHLRVEPRGKFPLTQSKEVTLLGGVASGVVVDVEDLHSTASIWVEHIGTDEQPGSYATGLSPVITVRNPTLRNSQEVDSGKHMTSALRGEFVQIDFEGRIGVVTGVMSDGFYVTDITEPAFAYSSVFVYSHSYPNVNPGDRIVALAGTVDEYYGFTELSFPLWKVKDEAPLPEPIQITGEFVSNNDVMEQYESAYSQVTDVEVCQTGSDYTTYGQWSVLVDPTKTCSDVTGQINIISTYTTPDFYPPAHVGEVLKSITGNLRFHSSASPSWILYTRTPEDIVLGEKQ